MQRMTRSASLIDTAEHVKHAPSEHDIVAIVEALGHEIEVEPNGWLIALDGTRAVPDEIMRFAKDGGHVLDDVSRRNGPRVIRIERRESADGSFN